MELARYLAIIKRWWWTIFVATWAAGLAGYVAASQLPATYQSEATVLVGPVSADLDTQRAAGQLVQTYAEIVRSRPLVEATIEDLGLSDSAATLRQRISAIADSTTRFLTVRVQHGSPDTAAAIANTLIEKLSDETGSGTIRPEGEPHVWEVAAPNDSPVAPDIGLITFLAGAAGLIGALVLVIAVEYVVAPVRDVGGLALASGVEALGVVDTWRPRVSVPRGRLLVNVGPDSSAALAYRLLARRLEAVGKGTFRSVCFISPTQGLGGGEVAGNTAAAMAMAGLRVALIDANDEEQGASRLLGRWGQRGLDDVVDRGMAALPGLLEASGRLQIVGHGPRVSLPLIDATDTRAVIDTFLASGRIDMVVLDGGVATSGSNALLWASAADAAIVVAKRDQTRSSVLARVSELLSLAGANLIGSVLHARRLRNLRQPSEQRAGEVHETNALNDEVLETIEPRAAAADLAPTRVGASLPTRAELVSAAPAAPDVISGPSEREATAPVGRTFAGDGDLPAGAASGGNPDLTPPEREPGGDPGWHAKPKPAGVRGRSRRRRSSRK